jgi:uncharacterized protein
MNEPVRVRFTKWDGGAHWAFDMRRLGEDEYGTWLWAPAGTELRRGSERTVTTGAGFIKLITPGRWWTAVWNDRGGGSDGTIDVYVDVITPAVWEEHTIRMVDLDLDVVRRLDGSVEIADQDEFDEHRIALGYPEAVVAMARTVTARLAIDVEQRVEPFGAVGDRWCEVARDR